MFCAKCDDQAWGNTSLCVGCRSTLAVEMIVRDPKRYERAADLYVWVNGDDDVPKLVKRGRE